MQPSLQKVFNGFFSNQMSHNVFFPMENSSLNLILRLMNSFQLVDLFHYSFLFVYSVKSVFSSLNLLFFDGRWRSGTFIFLRTYTLRSYVKQFWTITIFLVVSSYFSRECGRWIGVGTWVSTGSHSQSILSLIVVFSFWSPYLYHLSIFTINKKHRFTNRPIDRNEMSGSCLFLLTEAQMN